MKAWCGRCYRVYPNNPFPVQEATDEDKEGLHPLKEGEEHRFVEGWNGNHLMGIPFQCDLCHFRNLMGRDPLSTLVESEFQDLMGRESQARDGRDEFLLLCIRRAILDAMWARKPDTVSSNLGQLRRMHRDGKNTYGLHNPLPLLGPFLLIDTCDMKPAVLALKSSLCRGKYTGHLQWDTMRIPIRGLGQTCGTLGSTLAVVQ